MACFMLVWVTSSTSFPTRPGSLCNSACSLQGIPNVEWQIAAGIAPRACACSICSTPEVLLPAVPICAVHKLVGCHERTLILSGLGVVEQIIAPNGPIGNSGTSSRCSMAMFTRLHTKAVCIARSTGIAPRSAQRTYQRTSAIRSFMDATSLSSTSKINRVPNRDIMVQVSENGNGATAADVFGGAEMAVLALG